jgi:formate dehydrogenase iron-sulfur subunit
MEKQTNQKALLIDISRCIGCNACQDACPEQSKLEKVKEGAAITSLRTCSVKDEEVYVRQLCRHCKEPACKSVCLVDAFTKTAEGAVLYDGDKCIGCRNCMQACPFYVPIYEWGSTFPRVRKCVLCSERIAKEGEVTACAEACSYEATNFGDFDDMVAEANRRLGEEPEYVQRIYGLKEVGGTTVLYISKVPFEQLGFDAKLADGTTPDGFIPKVGDGPMPELTGRALAKVPNVVCVGAALLGGIWWITNRRHEVEQNEANNDSHK